MDCMFSGEAADSKEHIIPAWMQRRFNLANQTHMLPNGTTIRYALATVPVAAAHNARFGEIEDRIANGRASDQDIYLWAFKIHIGLIYRNSNLKLNIRSPSSPKFWSLTSFEDEIWLFQQLYAVWAQDGDIQPNPFGSVIRVPAFDLSAPFDFIHNMQAETVMFQLGGELIFVALYDQGRLSRSNIGKMIEHHRGVIAAMPEKERAEAAFVGHRVWACEASYALFRTPLKGLSFIKTETSFHALPSAAPQMRPANKDELEQFCQSFGLELARFGGEVNHVFKPLDPANIKPLTGQGFAAARPPQSSDEHGKPG